MEMGNATQEEMEKIVAEGKPLQERAFNAMIEMAKFKGLEVAFDKLMAKLFEQLEPLFARMIEWIEKGLVATEKLIDMIDSDIASHSAKEFGSATIAGIGLNNCGIGTGNCAVSLKKYVLTQRANLMMGG